MRFQSWNLLLAVRKGLGFKKDDTLRSRMKIPVSVMAFPEIVWSLLLSAGPSLPVNSHSIDFPYSLAILYRIVAPGSLSLRSRAGRWLWAILTLGWRRCRLEGLAVFRLN